jgi:hypothetical protein
MAGWFMFVTPANSQRRDAESAEGRRENKTELER